MHRTKVRVVEDALDANNTIARANRADFDRAGVRVVNLMSAPGAGKTTLLERVLSDGLGASRVGVLEGDVQGSYDADRLSALHVPVTQLNTDNGLRRRVSPRREHGAQRACPRSRSTTSTCSSSRTWATWSAPPSSASARTCGRWSRSVTEGEDKPLKYPLMFRACELVILNKIDLLPHLDFDVDRFLDNLDAGASRASSGCS